MSVTLNTELFLIPNGGTYLVYAPRRDYVMRLDAASVNLLTRLKRGRPRKADADTDLVKALKQAGIINGKKETPPSTAVGTPYAPTRVTLLLTNRCNLGCRYCYAGRQTGDMVMPEQLGKAAIEYAATNCVKRGKKVLELGIHGGGEATTAWHELVTFLEYGKEIAAANSLDLRAGLATNAVMSTAKAEWIAANVSNVNVSLDGPPRIQDAMRPTRAGKPTSGVIRRTLKILEEHDTRYGIQSTVTTDTVADMPRIVAYFARYTKPALVKFEPVSDCGRYHGHRDQIPSGYDFARYFNQAYEVGARKGLHVAFSGIRLFGPGLSYFCGAFGEPFAVTPDGFVSACYEAYSADAPFAETFLFGRYDERKRSFAIDKRKLEGLRKRNIYTLPACKKCFCRYSCAGDCATRNFRHSGRDDLSASGARCDAIREITRYRLAAFVENAGKQFVKKEETHVEVTR